MKDIQKFYQEHKQNLQGVLCDFFDTIVTRSVYPEYVKKIWAKKIYQMTSIPVTPQKLYEMRRDWESRLCKENLKNGFDLEFSYATLCVKLHEALGENGELLLNQQDFSTLCLETEISVEKSVQRLDQGFLEFANFLQKEKIPLICVSDFYLPEKAIWDFLKYHKIDHLITKVYVSSNYLLTKRSGRLYDNVLQLLDCSPKQLMMFGDNPISDYEVPQTKGIAAYLINRTSIAAFYSEHQAQAESFTLLTQKINGLFAAKAERAERDFFAQISLTFYIFCEKLFQELVRKKVKNVFFLAREGQFLKKMFDLYQQKQGITEAQWIRSHYFLVSRKSTFLPSLRSLEQEDFEILFRQYRQISPYEFLASLNFTDEEIESIDVVAKDAWHIREADFKHSSIFTEIRNNKSFAAIYEAKRQDQKTCFENYLSSFNAEYKTEGLHIVDVGWKGTIQDNIAKILPDVNIFGYYLGLVGLGSASSNNCKAGLVFSAYPTQSAYYKIYNENRAIFEIVLAASHGSAVAYQESNAGVVAVTHEEKLERELFINHIAPLQSHLFSCFEQICEWLVLSHFSEYDLAELNAKLHAKLVLFPTEPLLAFFQGLYHFENFGVFEITRFDSEAPTFFQRVKNILKLCIRPRKTLLQGFWVPLTLKKLGLGFLTPLYGTYRYIQNFKAGIFR